jgi:hypothetical protein
MAKKKKIKKKIAKKDVTPFESVVLNAIDFLKTSLNELESRPKYSMINFCSAIELFFKARLLKEHWSLILTKPEKANLIAFQNGDFKSVSLVEANQRLNNICTDGLTGQDLKHFVLIRDHRNKLVHFFNSAYSKKSETAIYEVISEQCKAWYHLHRLLTLKWEDIFKEYAKDIERLNKKMLSNRKFLKAKFITIKDQLKNKKSKSITIQKCYACGYVSSEEAEIHDPLYETKCHVCLAVQIYLKVPCSNPGCTSNVFIYDLAEGECEKCGQHIDIAYLIDRYGQHISPKELMSGPPAEAYCHECDFVPAPVIPLGEDLDEWLCLNCLEIHDRPSECEFCNEYVTGDLESSYAFGCTNCSGSFGWED